jgi:hypothetical protein
VTYVDKKVTAYKAEWKTKDVECTVMKPVTKYVDETVKYTVMEQKVEKKTITENYCECVNVQEQFTYTEMQQKTEKKTVKENYCECVTVQEPYTYTEMVQKVEPRKQIVTSYRCETHQVQECVPVCRRVRVCCVDPCTGCSRMVWTTVTENVTRCRNVVTRVPVQTEVTCNYVTCTPVQKQGTRTVQKMVPKTRDVVVEYCVCVPVQKQGTRTCQKMVPKTRQVTIDVCTCVPVQKTQVVKRCVTECVATKVVNKVQYCEMVPYETTVKVAVCTPCTTPCATTSCCPPPCHRTGLFARLFHRNNCCTSACGSCCN